MQNMQEQLIQMNHVMMVELDKIIGDKMGDEDLLFFLDFRKKIKTNLEKSKKKKKKKQKKGKK